jgi:hypothetical protein
MKKKREKKRKTNHLIIDLIMNSKQFCLLSIFFCVALTPFSLCNNFAFSSSIFSSEFICCLKIMQSFYFVSIEVVLLGVKSWLIG